MESTTVTTPVPETPDPAPVETPAAPTPPEAPKPDEPPKAPEPEDRLSKGFAELTRKEKALRKEAEAHKQELAEAKAWAELKGKLKDDPSLFLSEVAERFGVSIDAAAAAFAGKLAPQTVESRLEKLEREKAEAEAKAVADRERAEAEQQEKARTAFLATLHTEIRDHVSAKAEECEAITCYQALHPAWDVGKEIFEFRDAHYRQTGEVLEVPDVVAKVEGFLVAEIERYAKGLMGAKKFAALFGVKSPDASDKTAAVKAIAKSLASTSKVEPQEDDPDRANVKAITNRAAATRKPVARYAPTRDDDAVKRAVEATLRAAGKR